MLLTAFRWLDANLPWSAFLRESPEAFATLLTAHAVTMGVFVGLVAMMDLRLVGIGHRHTPFSQLQRSLFPWQMAAMALAALTGLLLLYSQPLHYYGKGFFWLKMGLMALAGVNALAFHRTTYVSVAAWDSSTLVPRGARLAGAGSLVLWAGVLIFGRLVAYDWFTRFYEFE